MKTKTKTQQALPRPIAPQVCYMERSEVADGQVDPLILFRKPVPEMAEGVRVLVIELSEESVGALIKKAKRAADRVERARYPYYVTAHESVMTVLSAIGIKPARVAKRKKAK